MRRSLSARLRFLEQVRPPLQVPRILIRFVDTKGGCSPAYVFEKGGLLLADEKDQDPSYKPEITNYCSESE
jgi:hypothetical protein